MSRLAPAVFIVLTTAHVLSREAIPDFTTGHAALGLALRRLGTTGTLMLATAHPDDENNALLAIVSRGLGMRTTLATATRGDGGQNEIGPELFDALAALRTEELLAAHRFDGAEQFFTRAVDFGYSFSVEETFQRWGHDEILDDYVRLIRMIRPDVIVALRPDGAGGGQHHQASARLAREAFRAAGDPSKFPDQLREGLRPWQAAKFYFSGPFGFRGEPAPDPAKKFVTIDLEQYDPLLGRTYAEIGSEARAMHKCQGFGQLLALPGRASARYELVDTTIPAQLEKTEQSLFDGLDTSLPAIVRYAGTSARSQFLFRELVEGVFTYVDRARFAFQSGDDAGVFEDLRGGLAAIRRFQDRVKEVALDDNAQYEMSFRLAQKAAQFQEALLLALGLRIELLADDGVVVGGQPVKITAIVANRGSHPVEIRRLAVASLRNPFACPPGWARPGGVYTCSIDGIIPPDAQPTGVHFRRRQDADRYDLDPAVPFGAPFAPTPFRALLTLDVQGGQLELDRPVEYRYEGDIFSGEKRMELTVVPAFGVRVDPEIAIVGPAPSTRPSTRSARSGQDPSTRSARGAPSTRVARSGQGPSTRAARSELGGNREIRVTVTSHGKGSASSSVALRVPDQWTATPERADVSFTREDEAQTVRFSVRAPAGVKTGEYRVDAMVGEAGGSALAALGVQVVEYPHIQRRHLLNPAVVAVKALDVRIAPDLTVGYVMGVGDHVPQPIAQLGAQVEMLDATDLAWGDLSRFDVIMTGVRAYERRADLRAHNHRLLDYASRGGVVIVQYNKFEFNEAQYGPYPAKVSGNRITDERAPVTVLVPDHPVFHRPNEIDRNAWDGWVQERGLYFLGDRAPEYVDLVEMTDPFENNRGAKRGALVEAKVGKGRWLYVGLGLWRQLPAGTAGAYKLLANLLSLAR